MGITEIKQQLHEFIEQADDKKIKGLFLLVEDEIESSKGIQLSEDQLAFLNSERAKYIAGEGESYTWEQASKIIRGKN